MQTITRAEKSAQTRKENDRIRAVEARRREAGKYPPEWNQLPLTSFDCLDAEASRYFNGARCRAGHLSPRDRGRNCIQCVQAKNQRQYKLLTEEARRGKAAYLRVYRARPQVKESATAYFSSLKIKASKRAYMARHEVRVASRLRSRVRCALQWSAGSRSWGKIWDVVGCSRADLISHLESLFLPGMSWENMGEWHIDHIRPCASFDLTDTAQQYQCFHYTNLQPLWAADNLAKSNKWEAA